MNELAGKPLRYKIGMDNPGPGRIGEIIEVAYDIETPPPVGLSVGYCNLFDESSTGAFPPYRPITDTAKQYNELVPDASGPGFEANLRAQFTRRRDGGFRFVELDNPDAYALKDVIRATDLAQSYGLGVIAKNPLSMDEDATAWLRHGNVYGVIVEKDAGTPDQMQVMRTAAGKATLPIWFVFFGDGLSAARTCAIRAGKFSNMSVTFDRAADEYGGEVEDFQLPQTQEPFMAEPAHLTLARSLIGKIEDGPQVPQLAMEIAQAFPDMAAYCRLATVNTSWCGIFIAVVLLRAYGTRPAYTPGNDLGSFMWADAPIEANWGTPVQQPQPGDILIFRSPHHITFYVGDAGDRYRCIGGNQSDGVSETTFAKSGLRAIIRPPVAGAIAQPTPLRPAVSNFDKCLPLLLVHEGGNDDDPRDPGGRTSRGILQSEWDVWRQFHPGPPSDVWQAPQDQVAAIYREKYWDALWCDQLPSGVDYAVFDYGVNSGISRSAKVLQRIVIPQEVDGEVGPNTVAATARADPATLIGQICDERLVFLQGLSTWPTFGNGWGRRVREVRAAALEMAATPKPTGNPMPKATEPQIFLPGQPLPQPQQLDLRPLLEALLPLIPALLQAFQQAKAGQPITIPQLLPAAPKPLPVPPPTIVIEPPKSNVSLPGASVGLTISGILAALMGEGVIGGGFGFGQTPTIWGTIATVASVLAPVIGGAGAGSGLLNAGSKLLGLFGFERKKPA